MKLNKALAIFFLVPLLTVSCGKLWNKEKDKDSGSEKKTKKEKSGEKNQPSSPEEAFKRSLPPQTEDFPITDSAIKNLSDLITELNLGEYHQKNFHGQNMKIAILDNGFLGVDKSIGRYLPPDTEMIKGSANAEAQTAHGTKLAEIVYGLATGRNTYSAAVPGPKIILINSNGYTNFVRAVDEVVARHIDIVLYAQVWEYGGNLNGGGFINKEVNRAVENGVLWINAAGNFGNTTFHSQIKIDPTTKSVFLPHAEKYVRFNVPYSGAPVKIVLAWNDFDESKEYHTPLDLDLILEDSTHQEVMSARKIQDGKDHGNDTNYSAHAREIIKGDLNMGTYYLRVEARSDNFDQFSMLRITIDGFEVKMLDNSTDNTVLIPADNQNVLTIGAYDVNYSGSGMNQNTGIQKPEVYTKSAIDLEDGNHFEGTSSASAIAAGALAVYFSANGKVDKKAIDNLLQNGELTSNSGQIEITGSDNEDVSIHCENGQCSNTSNTDGTSSGTIRKLRLPDLQD